MVRRTRLSAVLILVALLTLVGCSGDDSEQGTVDRVEITIEGDSVTPNGDRLRVAIGEPVDLEVTADEAGTLHVHSEPEQELDYDAGSTTITVQLDRPGVVAIESHELDEVIVSLEVR